MKPDRIYILITVFTAGLASLAVELSASRLLGNVFGTSNLVWATIIGLILIYLTVGYTIGGRWADKSPYPTTFFKILLWAAFFIGLVPLVSRPILRLSAEAFDALNIGILAGSFISVIVLFILPVTLLGTASPFGLRLLLNDPAATGRTAGLVSAVSTGGSFIGTFLPVLLLIPTIGTYRTFLAIGGLLMLVALGGLWQAAGPRTVLRFVWMPLILILLAIFGVQGWDRSTQGMIYEKETPYNYIQVLELDGYRYLRLNDGQGMHSVYHPQEIDYHGPWEQVMVAPMFNAQFDPAGVERAAIVGLAAGTTARQLTAVYGAIPIDGYEIDPDIIEVGQRYFGMDLPNINAIAEDGRWGLEHSPYRYDIISVDAYRPPYIPPHLTTREFFQMVHDHLTEDGVMAINIGRSPEDRQLIDALGTTIDSVFSDVYVMDVPYSFNSVLFATRQPTRLENFYANYLAIVNRSDINPLLITTAQTTIASLQPHPAVSQVFTDDLAPIEWLTNNLVLSYLFTEGVEGLQ
ncbi:MAG TPA: fused MFS/spermidine synthase [Anaerolineaceae bacterium]|nr:fused MFS/spermidine synthase [Anaerolineaceae bacterium]HPN53955.1 fused MFS/spermidine synthase [Anaerolineaceae bacterium]